MIGRRSANLAAGMLDYPFFPLVVDCPLPLVEVELTVKLAAFEIAEPAELVTVTE